jgi:hypothetical protein
MDFDRTVEFCKKWFEETEVEIPKTAREWGSGKSGQNIPPLCTYQSLRSRGIKVGALLAALSSNYKYRLKNKDRSTNFLCDLGLTFVEKGKGEALKYSCNLCHKIYETRKGTLRRWQEQKLKYCSCCRGASGKIKPLSYYQEFLDKKEFVVVDKQDAAIIIQHTKCGHTFSRGQGYLVGDQRSSSDLLSCPKCTKNFSYDKIRGYSSLIEKELTEYLCSLVPETLVQREVLYKDIMDTERNYRLDIWIPQLKIGLEITSPGNNIPKYEARLKEKLSLAESLGVRIYKVTSKSNIEDIVRPLLKGREH